MDLKLAQDKEMRPGDEMQHLCIQGLAHIQGVLEACVFVSLLSSSDFHQVHSTTGFVRKKSLRTYFFL